MVKPNESEPFNSLMSQQLLKIRKVKFAMNLMTPSSLSLSNNLMFVALRNIRVSSVSPLC